MYPTALKPVYRLEFSERRSIWLLIVFVPLCVMRRLGCTCAFKYCIYLRLYCVWTTCGYMLLSSLAVWMCLTANERFYPRRKDRRVWWWIRHQLLNMYNDWQEKIWQSDDSPSWFLPLGWHENHNFLGEVKPLGILLAITADCGEMNWKASRMFLLFACFYGELIFECDL